MKTNMRSTGVGLTLLWLTNLCFCSIKVSWKTPDSFGDQWKNRIVGLKEFKGQDLMLLKRKGDYEVYFQGDRVDGNTDYAIADLTRSTIVKIRVNQEEIFRAAAKRQSARLIYTNTKIYKKLAYTNVYIFDIERNLQKYSETIKDVSGNPQKREKFQLIHNLMKKITRLHNMTPKFYFESNVTPENLQICAFVFDATVLETWGHTHRFYFTGYDAEGESSTDLPEEEILATDETTDDNGTSTNDSKEPTVANDSPNSAVVKAPGTSVTNPLDGSSPFSDGDTSAALNNMLSGLGSTVDKAPDTSATNSAEGSITVSDDDASYASNNRLSVFDSAEKPNIANAFCLACSDSPPCIREGIDESVTSIINQDSCSTQKTLHCADAKKSDNGSASGESDNLQSKKQPTLGRGYIRKNGFAIAVVIIKGGATAQKLSFFGSHVLVAKCTNSRYLNKLVRRKYGGNSWDILQTGDWTEFAKTTDGVAAEFKKNEYESAEMIDFNKDVNTQVILSFHKGDGTTDYAVVERHVKSRKDFKTKIIYRAPQEKICREMAKDMCLDLLHTNQSRFEKFSHWFTREDTTLVRKIILEAPVMVQVVNRYLQEIVKQFLGVIPVPHFQFNLQVNDDAYIYGIIFDASNAIWEADIKYINLHKALLDIIFEKTKEELAYDKNTEPNAFHQNGFGIALVIGNSADFETAKGQEYASSVLLARVKNQVYIQEILKKDMPNILWRAGAGALKGVVRAFHGAKELVHKIPWSWLKDWDTEFSCRWAEVYDTLSEKKKVGRNCLTYGKAAHLHFYLFSMAPEKSLLVVVWIDDDFPDQIIIVKKVIIDPKKVAEETKRVAEEKEKVAEEKKKVVVEKKEEKTTKPNTLKKTIPDSVSNLSSEENAVKVIIKDAVIGLIVEETLTLGCSGYKGWKAVDDNNPHRSLELYFQDFAALYCGFEHHWKILLVKKTSPGSRNDYLMVYGIHYKFVEENMNQPWFAQENFQYFCVLVEKNPRNKLRASRSKGSDPVKKIIAAIAYGQKSWDAIDLVYNLQDEYKRLLESPLHHDFQYLLQVGLVFRAAYYTISDGIATKGYRVKNYSFDNNVWTESEFKSFVYTKAELPASVQNEGTSTAVSPTGKPKAPVKLTSPDGSAANESMAPNDQTPLRIRPRREPRGLIDLTSPDVTQQSQAPVQVTPPRVLTRNSKASLSLSLSQDFSASEGSKAPVQVPPPVVSATDQPEALIQLTIPASSAIVESKAPVVLVPEEDVNTCVGTAFYKNRRKWKNVCIIAGYKEWTNLNFIQFDSSGQIHFYLLEARVSTMGFKYLLLIAYIDDKKPKKNKPINRENIDEHLIVILHKAELTEEAFIKFAARRNFVGLFKRRYHTQTIMHRTVGQKILFDEIELQKYEYIPPKEQPKILNAMVASTKSTEDKEAVVLLSTRHAAFQHVTQNERNKFDYYKSDVYFDQKYGFHYLRAFVFQKPNLKTKAHTCTWIGKILPIFGEKRALYTWLAESEIVWKTVVMMTKADFVLRDMKHSALAYGSGANPVDTSEIDSKLNDPKPESETQDEDQFIERLKKSTGNNAKAEVLLARLAELKKREAEAAEKQAVKDQQEVEARNYEGDKNDKEKMPDTLAPTPAEDKKAQKETQDKKNSTPTKAETTPATKTPEKAPNPPSTASDKKPTRKENRLNNYQVFRYQRYSEDKDLKRWALEETPAYTGWIPIRFFGVTEDKAAYDRLESYLQNFAFSQYKVWNYWKVLLVKEKTRLVFRTRYYLVIGYHDPTNKKHKSKGQKYFCAIINKHYKYTLAEKNNTEKHGVVIALAFDLDALDVIGTVMDLEDAYLAQQNDIMGVAHIASLTLNQAGNLFPTLQHCVQRGKQFRVFHYKLNTNVDTIGYLMLMYTYDVHRKAWIGCDAKTVETGDKRHEQLIPYNEKMLTKLTEEATTGDTPTSTRNTSSATSTSATKLPTTAPISNTNTPATTPTSATKSPAITPTSTTNTPRSAPPTITTEATPPTPVVAPITTTEATSPPHTNPDTLTETIAQIPELKETYKPLSMPKQLPLWRSIATLDISGLAEVPADSKIRWNVLRNKTFQIDIENRLKICGCTIVNKDEVIKVKYLDERKADRYSVILGISNDSYFFVHKLDELIVFYRPDIPSYIAALSAVENYWTDIVEIVDVRIELNKMKMDTKLPIGILYYTKIPNVGFLAIFLVGNNYYLLRLDIKTGQKKWGFKCQRVETLLRIRKSYVISNDGWNAYEHLVKLVWIENPYPNHQKIKPKHAPAFYNILGQLGRLREWALGQLYRKIQNPLKFEERKNRLRIWLADSLQKDPIIESYGVYDKADQHSAKSVKDINGAGGEDLSKDMKQMFVLVSIKPFMEKPEEPTTPARKIAEMFRIFPKITTVSSLLEDQLDRFQVVNVINFTNVDLDFSLGGYSSPFFPIKELAQDAVELENMLNGY